MTNRPGVPLDEMDVFVTGWRDIAEQIQRLVYDVLAKGNSTCIMGIDGYVGTDWKTIKAHLAKGFLDKQIRALFMNVEDCLLPGKERDELFQPYLGDDPVLGRIYKKHLVSLYDVDRLIQLKKSLSHGSNKAGLDRPQVIVVYGTGALLSLLHSKYDVTLYFDLTRETVLRRNKDWTSLSGKTQSISPKKLYYVDMPVNDKHRNRLLDRIDYYVDANDDQAPVLVAAQTLQKVTAAVASEPIRLKYLYEPGPWGGQWLKEIRHLPADWVNCAWSYEVIATEMSLLVEVAAGIIELPWTTFFYQQYDRVMGNVPRRRFGGEFPVRFDYLDTMDGDNLSIQVHPGTSYVQQHFGERYHQGEMYYIVDAKEGSSVNLGLKEGANIDEFHQAAVLADEKGIAFDYTDYVNKVPGKKHDLLLIPPGTVHGSGEGLVVLEISATTYRYTFKIYDYLRPDLNGIMRPIHIKNAFDVIKQFRRTEWVRKNLIQSPRLVRSGEGWAEYLIGDRREFFHVVFRLEFESQVVDDTSGNFHLLTLVEGDAVELHALEDENKSIRIGYSETVIIPACLGKYSMTNQGQGNCKVVKARLR